MEHKINLGDGLLKQNMVFMSGLLTAPVIACTTTLPKSLAVCFVFSFVSLLTILVCRFIPRTIVYTIRVTLYSVAAAVFYIPTILLADALFGTDVISAAGIYLPVLITNSLILSKTETRFYLEPMGLMTADVVIFIIGFDVSCTLTGVLRELLASGKIGGAEIPVLFTIPAAETTFGGFLFIGIGAGLFRAVYNYRKAHANEDDTDSLAEYAEDMGEFLVGRHGGKPEREKIRIYKATAKKTKNVNELLDMEFLSNRDVLEAFEAIIAEGREMTSVKPAEAEGEADSAADDGTGVTEQTDTAEETKSEDNDGSIS